MVLARFLVAISALGCKNGDATVDAMIDSRPDLNTMCAVGDVSAPMELQPGYINQNAFTPVTELSPVTMQTAGQGNYILVMGVRARNVNACAQYTLTIALRDTCANTLMSVESRTSVLMDTGDGWAVPRNISYYAIAGACPQVSPMRDIFEQPYKVELILSDDNGKEAMTSVHVVPTCPLGADNADCLCTCDRDYVLGGVCPPATDTGPGPNCPPP